MLTVLTPEEGESSGAFIRRAEKIEGDLLLIQTALEGALVKDKEQLKDFLEVCSRMSSRVRLGSRNHVIIGAARAKGLRVIDRVADLRKLLHGHPNADEALREFSPVVWRQQLRSRLQGMGLLSMPKLRIWTLITVSVLLFFFVVFRLLPSADVRIYPREDSVTQTANIFLVLSGASVDIPQRVRTMELIPLEVNVSKSITFDQISKEFIGKNATVAMTIINESDEEFALLKDTRVTNQAGMVFRLQQPLTLKAGEERTVRAVADDLDMYHEIIGARGNVPADLRWDLPGLSQEERKLVYAINREEATGGTTGYRTVLHRGDLEVAQIQLEQELLTTAKQLVDEERILFNSESPDQIMEILYYDELTKAEYHDFTLPEQFLGEPVISIPVDGSITYIAYAYDTQYVLRLLQSELYEHVGEGKQILEDSMGLDRLVAHVIDYEDDLSWIKLTVDLSGTEQYILDPLTPQGAHFGKIVRDSVAGISVQEAERILKNLPEVENVDIRIWPPWSRVVPHIPTNIQIVPMQKEAAL